MQKISSFKILDVFKKSTQTVDWGLISTGVPSVWAETQGLGVRVAVLDTGADLNHPDLVDNIVQIGNFTNSPQGANDVQGHGTHCAGIIGALNNDIGVIGVAPKVSLIIVKVLGDNGSGYNNWVANGIRYAVDMKADIISMSLGSSVKDPQIEKAVLYAYSKNIPIIAAAGNEGDGRGNTSEISYPAYMDETIAVGANGLNNRIARFSNSNDEVDIVAPGVNIYSTFPINSYAKLSGTSMATPFVTGVLALSLAKHRVFGGKTPMDTVEQMREHLVRFTVDAGKKGVDNLFGHGIIDPVGLITE